MRKKYRNILTSLRLYFSLPMPWVIVALLVLVMVSFSISRLLHNSEPFYSSIWSNIFAGLVTGLSISVIGGIKTTYCAFLEMRQEFLEEIHKMILDFLSSHNNLLHSINKLSDEEFFNAAYDTGARANWVNEKILHYTDFNKENWIDPNKYFLKRYDYDSLKTAHILEEFRESVYSIDVNSNSRVQNVELFRPIVKLMQDLNRQILHDTKLIKLKLASSKKSII